MTRLAKRGRLPLLGMIGILLFSLISGVSAPVAAAAGTAYYVDPDLGSDSAAGTSEAAAWKTLSKVNSITFSPGDVILLKAGGVWNNQYLDLQGSGAEGNPVTVDRYGTGAKPRINFGNTAVGGEGFGVRLRNVSYWEINNLEITSGQQPTDMRRSGVLVTGEGAGAGNFRHIYIRNLDIHDIFGTDRRTGGINVHARGANTAPESTWDGILIENNTVINVADTGIQTMTDAFFNSSWNHKFDAFRNVVIRGNVVEKIHRDGILVRASQSPLIEYNKTKSVGEACDVNTSIVSYLEDITVVAAQWAYYTKGAVFQYNEASDTRMLGGDGQPWDFDIEVHDSIYQYNFSYNNEGGTLLVMNNTNNNIFRYNISQNDKDANGVFHLVNGGGNLYVYNNIIYRSGTQNKALTHASNTGMAYYMNNIFYNGASGQYTNSPRMTYDHNSFYGLNSSVPSDPNKITGNPGFVSPGTAAGRDSADGYKLAVTSPLLNAGVAVDGNGGQDYFGNPLYYGVPDIGAFEFQGTIVPPAVLFQDDFEDNNYSGWTTSGGSWTVADDGTKALSQNSATGEALAYTGDAAWSNYTYSAKVKLLNAFGNAGLLFRYADAANYYMFRLNDSGDKAELFKKTAGTLTMVSSASVTVTPGQWTELKVTVSGSTLTCYAGGSQLIQWTDPAAQPAGGQVGIRMHSSTARIDDVKVTE
ncbi:family 16 glycoside hydrolase [Paenibacillus sp. MMS20-IR301]|uniref:family 16 glycoside hydrolase n=1 Tax=Paenibacillus sp. MMS20-IR301 TaxID=2895946 RepID=UPI0028E19E3E|nr:family 16 glycoside hydrolase [Paenibacillus sp. MMS20-IR301]WNS46192.1 family 16 glycoside hydrolase [Paenibacillus sp. MMS20-IR301]